ncbi:polyprenyl synthetase family protein [Campylobacter sp. 19-13652]|uniref:polyprenyl synthetase family protein n=1 Tax=Campylobacter sp. 19-13652 TaxID=2840180 RepID=UPI001C76E351|nr:polyprenyl synthetase family protein [Campylobacter sp. 19-13652]BCX79203.1 octaprenyl-diphosphate synthase [Campylobacter sp. 19-13652]
MQEINSLISSFIKELDYEPILQMYERISTGKMLRSKLIMAIAGSSENAINLCAIVEMIHLASLLHDDVIDEADTRRGTPSINALYGTKDAVMLGDVLYSKAFSKLSGFAPEISNKISNAVAGLSVGELMDVRLGDGFSVDVEAYWRMIYLKTAILIEASAYSAAVLAGFDADKFGVYGKSLGLAFQIIDDVLDITQSSEVLGKPALNDFSEGKTTLPYIYLYERLGESDKERLKSLYKKSLSYDEVMWLKKVMRESGAINECVNRAKTLAAEALEAISEYKNEKLQSIIKNMIDREF